MWQEQGLSEVPSPLESLESFRLPEVFGHCVLHILHLGLFTYHLNFLVSCLNSEGKDRFNRLMKSDLFPWSKSFRLRKLETTDKVREEYNLVFLKVYLFKFLQV